MSHETPEAQAIVDALFVNGSGERAYRLVLVTREGRDLGGWGEGPAHDAITRAIQAASPPAAETGRLIEELGELEYQMRCFVSLKRSPKAWGTIEKWADTLKDLLSRVSGQPVGEDVK